MTFKSLTPLTLIVAIAIAGCNSSDISGTSSAPNSPDGSITVTATSATTLESLPDIGFGGVYETNANPGAESGGGGDSDILATADTEADGVAGDVSSSTDDRIAGPTNPGTSITPGTLTAGDYDDQLNPHLYQRYASDYLQRRGQWIDVPRLDFNNRIHILVNDKSGNPIANARVDISGNNAQQTSLQTAANGHTAIYKELDALPASFTLRATAPDGLSIQKDIDLQQAIDAGAIHVVLATDTQSSDTTPVDLMFVVDTTGSMRDELSFLQTELSDIISAIPQQLSDINIGLVFYRDYGDAYVVRAHDFTSDLNAVQLNLNQEQAQGGGDYPEAMDQALQSAVGANWRDNSRKILFHIADAPPHGDRMRATWNAAELAREKNIHLVPLAASGVGEDAEYIMRSIAALTNSRYTFLTDDSGFGLPHAEPEIDCYVVTSLQNTMIRVLNSLITGKRVEPTANDIVRTEGNYNNGVCDPQDTPTDNVEYSIVVDRFSSLANNTNGKRTVVISDQSTLESELAIYQEPMFSVDFDAQQVLLVDMGTRNTGGYSINVNSITDNGDYVQANIEFVIPGQNCAVTQALTNPLLMATVSTRKEIRVVETTVARDCPL